VFSQTASATALVAPASRPALVTEAQAPRHMTVFQSTSLVVRRPSTVVLRRHSPPQELHDNLLVRRLPQLHRPTLLSTVTRQSLKRLSSRCFSTCPLTSHLAFLSLDCVQAPQALTATPSTLRPGITFIDPSFELFTHRHVRVPTLPGLPFSGAPGRILNVWPSSSAESHSRALVPYLAASSSRAIVREDAMMVCTRRRLLVRRSQSPLTSIYSASPP
jgi:hypothetical protein